MKEVATDANQTVLPGGLPGRFSRPDHFLGRTVGNFRLTRVLGRGGMGTVYLGEHPLIGSKVAVKMLHPQYSRDAEVISRFLAEGLVVNMIGHPNIVKIYDLASLDGEHYYCVMEYLEGQTLAQRIAHRPLAFDEAVPVFVQIADALAAAHHKGVVHRDLKPENVFLIEELRGWAAKIVDFGVAKVLSLEERGTFADGAVVGTPHYMAPEQSEGGDADARSDVYALGITMYYAATGALPYDGGSYAEILLKHDAGAATPPRSIRGDVPRPYEAIILKAMARVPRERFQSMAEIKSALTDLLGVSKPGRHRPTEADNPANPDLESVLTARRPRRALRHRAQVEVGIQLPGQEGFEAMTATDISQGGMFVATTGAIPPLFTIVQVALSSPGSEPVLLKARIVRKVTALESRDWNIPPGMGLEFVDVGDDRHHQVVALIGAVPKAAG